MHIENLKFCLSNIPTNLIVVLKGKANRGRYIKKMTELGYTKGNFYDTLKTAYNNLNKRFVVLPDNVKEVDPAIIDHMCFVIECEPMYSGRTWYTLTVNTIRDIYQQLHDGLPMKEYRNWSQSAKNYLKDNYKTDDNINRLCDEVTNLMQKKYLILFIYNF